MDRRPLRLVLVPSNAIEEYERAGYGSWLEGYYNPGGMFGEVIALSPLERGERRAYGMTIRGVTERKFGQALRDLRPDAVRAYGGGWATELVCRHRLPGTPIVASVHTTDRAAVSRALRHVDLVLCTSGIVADIVRAVGVDNDRVRILPNRVDLDVFHPVTDAEALAAVSRRFPPGRHILHVGRRSEQKNVDTLVRAVAHLPAEYHAVFVGQGPVEPYVELAQRLGVERRCAWIDAIDNRELPAWYSWCDCMCTPSRWEGFGIVFVEAAACGAAIVTSDIPPLNEYLEHDVSACLVPAYEDPGSVAAAIRRVCENPEYRARLSDGARDAASVFARPVVDRREAELYREALALPPTRARGLSWRDRIGLQIWSLFRRWHLRGRWSRFAP